MSSIWCLKFHKFLAGVWNSTIKALFLCLKPTRGWFSFHKITPRKSNLYFNMNKPFRFLPEGTFRRRGKASLEFWTVLGWGKRENTWCEGNWRSLRMILTLRPSLNSESHPQGTRVASEASVAQRIHAHLSLRDISLAEYKEWTPTCWWITLLQIS